MKARKVMLAVLCLFLVIGSLHADRDCSLDQTKRLATLAKVWGFLKYYHPDVATGEIDWDGALLAAIPNFKDAGDFDSFNAEVANLLVTAGDFSKDDYNPEPLEIKNPQMFKWTKDRSLFTKENRKELWMLKVKHVPAENHYVQAAQYTNQAQFSNELPYSSPAYPGEEMRLLALFRYWNIVQYFYPYKDEMDKDWEEVLDEFIPLVLEAEDEMAYHLTIRRLSTRLNDSHAFMMSVALTNFYGSYEAPFETRFIEGKTVVTRVHPTLLDSPEDVKVGDVILKVGDTGIETFRDNLRPYTPASNDRGIERNICRKVAMCTETRNSYTISRNEVIHTISTECYEYSVIMSHLDAIDAATPKWEILPGNIGYVHMGVMENDDVELCMTELMDTRAIIIDVRNYPNFILYYMCYFLVPNSTPFASFTEPDLGSPGDFNWAGEASVGWGNPACYTGRVVILANEQTQSRAEFTIMAFQAAPDATLIGTQTAGADGDITGFTVPGGLVTYMTGLGAFYADGSPTQRIGLLPDIEVDNTIEGLRQGRDEVIERAVQFIENE
ncbi:MAG: hypothetical protein GY757_52290 [bacterium]|nr:hypothetical protein [bacterium]